MSHPTDVDPSLRWRADATRYKLLSRLVPSMNHKMAGSMQPVAMLAGMMARHLQRPQPDIQVLGQNAADMQLACKTAVATRTEVLAWFQPSGPKRVAAAHAVAQCTSLLSAEFAIRDCAIDNQSADVLAEIDQGAVRSLVTATLFAILDCAAQAVTVQVRATASSNGEVALVIAWTHRDSAHAPTAQAQQHAIGWDDVHAMATQEGCGFQQSQSRAEIHFAPAP